MIGQYCTDVDLLGFLLSLTLLPASHDLMMMIFDSCHQSTLYFYNNNSCVMWLLSTEVDILYNEHVYIVISYFSINNILSVFFFLILIQTNTKIAKYVVNFFILCY